MCYSFLQQGFSRSARFGRSAGSLRALAPSLRGRRSLAPQLSLACSSLSGTLARLCLGPVSSANAQRVHIMIQSNCKNASSDAAQRSGFQNLGNVNRSQRHTVSGLSPNPQTSDATQRSGARLELIRLNYHC